MPDSAQSRRGSSGDSIPALAAHPKGVGVESTGLTLMDHRRARSFETPDYSGLARNTAATFVGRVSAIGLGVILSMMLFRALGPGRYGLWSLLVLLSGYSMMFDFGLSAAVEQRVARMAAANDPAEITRTINSAVAVVLIAVAVLEVIALGVWWWLSAAAATADLARTAIVLPLCIGMTATSMVIGAGLTGLQRMATLHIWRSLGMATGTAATLVLATHGVTRLDTLLVVYAVGGPLAATAQWLALRSLVPGLRFAPAMSRPVVAQLFRFGGVLQVATMAPVVGDYLFRLLVGARFGIAFSGVYDLAARAGIALRSVAGSLFTTLVPFGVHTLARGGGEEASRLTRVAVKYTALFILPATVLLFRYAGPLMHLWLGHNPAVVHVQHGFQVLLVAHAITSLSVPAAMLGRSAARPGPEALMTLLAAAVGLGAALLAPAFLVSIAVFGCAPPLGAIAVWIWLARPLGLEFRSGRDLLTVAAISAVGYLTAAGLDRLVSAAGISRPLFAVGAAMAGAVAVVALLVQVSGLVDQRERSLLRAAATRTVPTVAEAGSGQNIE